MSQSAVIQVLSTVLPVSFNIAATTTLVIWNTLLTLDEEFIGSSDFTFIKAVYFVVRYIPFPIFCGTTFLFFGNTDTNLCQGMLWLIVVGGSVITACSNILLIQRVYAFYERSKRMFWTLSLIFIIIEVLVMANVILDLPRVEITKDNFLSPIPELFGRCVIERFNPIGAYAWFYKLAFEIITFLCIIARFAKLQYVAWKLGLPNPRLYNVFLRDGSWAFLVSFLFLLFTAVLQREQNMAGLSLNLWALALSGICSTRLILNLNHAAKKTQHSGARSFAGYLVASSMAFDLNCDQVVKLSDGQ